MVASTKTKKTLDPISILEGQVKELTKIVKEQEKKLSNIDTIIEARIKVTNYKLRQLYLNELLALQTNAGKLVNDLTTIINKANIKNMMSVGELHLLSMHPDYLYREVPNTADGKQGKPPAGASWIINKYISGPNAEGKDCSYWMRKK